MELQTRKSNHHLSNSTRIGKHRELTFGSGRLGRRLVLCLLTSTHMAPGRSNRYNETCAFEPSREVTVAALTKHCNYGKIKTQGE